AHYETPYIKPTENSVPIEPVSLKELRRLKPEKASSTELASYFQNELWTLGVSASYNTIKDLFTWNQVSFRTINAGKYNFVNAEWEIRYSQHAFTLGANHVISQLVNTEKNNEGFDSVRQIVLYPVRDAISVDGKNFLNLSSHITKIFVDIRLSPLFSIHSNARLFWGLKGREPIHRFHEKQNANLQHYEADFFQNQKYPYLNTERALQAKWNAGIKFEFKNTTVQFLIYDILAPQYRSKNLHSLRYQQMAFSRIQTDIFAYDFRSYSVRLTLKL
ncbi:MAG: hypothetical protein MUF42_14845, partial [Cytophagaceae bacterium]|nr:hypothetical protein [Cytophagaceae bacterium]